MAASPDAAATSPGATLCGDWVGCCSHRRPTYRPSSGRATGLLPCRFVCPALFSTDLDVKHVVCVFLALVFYFVSCSYLFSRRRLLLCGGLVLLSAACLTGNRRRHLSDRQPSPDPDSKLSCPLHRLSLVSFDASDFNFIPLSFIASLQCLDFVPMLLNNVC